MFSNAKSVEINGKEVKSIILENGAILYEKEYPYVLAVSSNKDILSYADQDSATLTASLTKGGMPIEGEEVIFHTSNVITGLEEYYSEDWNYVKINLEGNGEVILPNNTQFGVQGFTEDGTRVFWKDLSQNGWKIKIDNGTVSFYEGTSTSPLGSSYNVGNKFSLKILSPSFNDLCEISSSYPVFFASATTQNTGQCSVTYSSKGVGDISINVECMNLQETYSLEDCLDYDPLIADNNKFALTGSANVSYSSNGLSMVGTANATSLYLYKGTLPSDFVFECDVVSYTVGAYNFGGEICVSHTVISNGVNNGNKTRFGTFTDVNYGNTGFTYTDVSRIDTPYHLKVEIDNGTATFYIDDVQKHQRSSGTADFGLKSYNNRGAVIKNMKIKPL